MAIETLDDILTEIADRGGIYGAHADDEIRPCRICFEIEFKQRILRAVEVEKKLAEPANEEKPFGPDWVRQKVEENQRGYGRKS